MNEWRKLGGDLAAKPGCDKPECYGQICVEPGRCYGEGQPSDLTPERLAELRRIAEAATPGPWEWRMSKDGRILDLISLETGYNEEIITPSHINAWLQVKGGLQDFIPAFDPATVLALLDRIEALQSMLLHLYQDTVIPGTGYCIRCGMFGRHGEWCSMSVVEELLGIEVKDDSEEEGGASDA